MSTPKANIWLDTFPRLAVLMAILVLMPASNAGAVRRAGLPLDLARVDRFITAQMQEHRIPGLALAITHGDQATYARGYGTARDGEPVTEQTQFRLASLSKSFTALAVLQLVEAGQVNLDMPVVHYVPEFTLATPAVAVEITVRQLLNQTSGLADTGFVDGLARQQPTLADRVASLRVARAIDPPGAAFHYFDPNYQVLARLIEVVSGQSFDDYLRTHIFAPLAMRDSVSSLTSDVSTQRAKYLAQGHIVVYGTPVPLSELSGFLGGSGGVISTAADMAHYLSAQSSDGQYAGRSILSAQNIALMHTPPTATASNYGMGWFASDVNGTRTFEHNGILSTCYAEAVLLPESGYGFVLLYNEYGLTSAALAFPALKNGLVALLIGQEPTNGKLPVPTLGFILAALTALGIGLALRSLLRLPRWAARAESGPCWRLVPGLAWTFAPGILLLGLPQLLAQSTDRYFDYVMLARAMPDIIIWLGLCAGLGGLNGVARLIILARHAQRTVTGPRKKTQNGS